MQNALEKSRFFPLIAWTIILLLSFFTYSVVRTLNNEIALLSATTNTTMSALNETP